MSAPALRQCPGCESAMQVFFASAPSGKGQVEIDRCFFCGGLWFDTGELEQLAGQPSRLRREGSGTPRRCAGCTTPLTTARWGGTPVDLCPTCGGFFLDDGELRALAGADVPIQRREAARPELDPDLSFRCVGCGERYKFSEGLATSSGLACDRCYARVEGSPNTVIASTPIRRQSMLQVGDYSGDLAVDMLRPALSRAARFILGID